MPSIGAAVGGDKAGTAHNVLRGPDPRPASKESKAPPDDDPLARQTGPRESKGILSLLLLSESNIWESYLGLSRVAWMWHPRVSFLITGQDMNRFCNQEVRTIVHNQHTPLTRRKQSLVASSYHLWRLEPTAESVDPKGPKLLSNPRHATARRRIGILLAT